MNSALPRCLTPRSTFVSWRFLHASCFFAREKAAPPINFNTSRFIIKKLRKTLRLSKPSSRPIRDSIRRTSSGLWTKTATVHPLTVPSFPRARIKLLRLQTSARDAHLHITARHQGQSVVDNRTATTTTNEGRRCQRRCRT